MITAKREVTAAPSFRPLAVSGTQIGEVTSITHIITRQDMSRWTREHADSPGITWSVEPGPGGTMLIVEHAHDRSSLPAALLITDGTGTDMPYGTLGAGTGRAVR